MATAKASRDFNGFIFSSFDKLKNKFKNDRTLTANLVIRKNYVAKVH
ncbi:ComEA protein [Aggregatibacter aphrophilus NJ8700]|nr:ComEA protein [Aggregatibacter aphrophilus NJ8700]